MCWVLFICKGSISFIKSINQSRITQQKEHLLKWNSETTQNLNIYLHNYQTEIAIFLATKHKKTIMACSCLIFSIQKIHQNSENGGFCEEVFDQNHFEAVLVNFCCYKYDANTSEPVQKHRLAQGHCWSYASSLNS